MEWVPAWRTQVLSSSQPAAPCPGSRNQSAQLDRSVGGGAQLVGQRVAAAAAPK
jgi:hypothetical protein